LRPDRSRLGSLVAGAAALGAGLGLGVPAAMALWFDTADLPEAVFQSGQVGFAVARSPKTEGTSLSDGTNEYSSDGHSASEIDDGADVIGTTLKAPVAAGAELARFAPDTPFYAKYVVTGRADANAIMTYTPKLILPGTLPPGVTVGSTVLLYYAGPEDPDNPVICGEDFFGQFDNAESKLPSRLEYSSADGAKPSLLAPGEQGLQFGTLVEASNNRGHHAWCLSATADPAAAQNTAEVKVSTWVGVKTDADDWEAVIKRSSELEDQLIIAFTPTVSRWIGE
jgi:hypothetical protein